MSTEREYVLGTDTDELQRLGFQHQVWAEQTSRLWQVARFAPGQRLLDLGCGPGYATLDLAQLVGGAGEIVAVDVSRRFLSALERLAVASDVRNVRVLEQDATALTLPAASLHGAFARWVLSFTPNPQAVVERVFDALAPGAPFAVFDYANYEAITLAPPSDAFDRVIAATARSVRDAGGGFDVGARLPALLQHAGFTVEHVEPYVRVARPHDALWAWPSTFFANYLPSLVERELITAEDANAFRHAWDERTRDPGAYLVTPTIVGIVARKPA
ncbi:MAG: methyltransferase domain-containing protein [Gemmatimonadaceae bacterium]|jgi:SAM-dependent methyltransferase|nr:methyltransferase domain-containing protein [Gemmatimonadaceae bacterium]